MDTFDKEVWKLGVDHPENREAIARTLTSLASEYTIPVRKLSTLTGELEPITMTVYEIEDPTARERAISDVKTAQSMTVRDLATRLGVLHIYYRMKEANGEELTPTEKTLRDLDITALAYTLRYMNYPKETHKSYDNGTELEADLKKLREAPEEK